jgi:hypothetical protein
LLRRRLPYAFFFAMPLAATAYAVRRFGYENKSLFNMLLFCISLDLHYLCTQNNAERPHFAASVHALVYFY